MYISLNAISEKEREQLHSDAEYLMSNGIPDKDKNILSQYYDYLTYMKNSFRFGVMYDIQFECSQEEFEMAKQYNLLPKTHKEISSP